jgi:hypothetical protein
MKLGRLVFFGAILLAARLGHAGGAHDFLARLEPTPPFPAACAAANTRGIPVSGIDPPATGATLAPGDSVTTLVTLHEKGRHATQWLLYFQVTNNVPVAAAKPQPPPMVMYTSTGGHFEFSRSPARLRVRTLGPFPEPNAKRRSSPAFDDDSAAISVNQAFLGIGLDQGAAAVIRWVNAGRQTGGTNFMDLFRYSPKPFGSSRTNHDRLLAAQWRVTPGEERSVAGWMPALTSYFGTVQQTPNLQGIMLKVLDLPSLWSIVRNRGLKVYFRIDHDQADRFSPANWGLPSDSPVYSLPTVLTINNHRALTVTLIVTAPRPPLLACGGIIGLLAENPADKENYLTLRLISAHCQSGLSAKN